MLPARPLRRLTLLVLFSVLAGGCSGPAPSSAGPTATLETTVSVVDSAPQATASTPPSGPPAAPSERVRWDQVATAEDLEHVIGGSAYVEAVRRLGFFKYGQDISPSITTAAYLLDGIKHCAMLRDAGYDKVLNDAKSSPPGWLLTKDYTLRMLAQQLKAAGDWLCPEFKTGPLPEPVDEPDSSASAMSCPDARSQHHPTVSRQVRTKGYSCEVASALLVAISDLHSFGTDARHFEVGGLVCDVTIRDLDGMSEARYHCAARGNWIEWTDS